MNAERARRLAVVTELLVKAMPKDELPAAAAIVSELFICLDNLELAAQASAARGAS